MKKLRPRGAPDTATVLPPIHDAEATVDFLEG